MYNFEYQAGKGLSVEINKEELDKLMEKDKHEDARKEDLEYLEECKSDKNDWDMKESSYL